MIDRSQSAGARRDAQTPRHRIVIGGGGAGGLPLVTRLGDGLGKYDRAEITLVARRNGLQAALNRGYTALPVASTPDP